MFILYVLLGLVAGVLLAGLLSPRVARVERSIDISASPEKIFPFLNSPRHFAEDFSPWTERDPSATYVYGDPPEGVGASVGWDGSPTSVGTGAMEIVESVPNRRVLVKFWFNDPSEPRAKWDVEDLGDGRSRVTWAFEVDNGLHPLVRIFGRWMDRYVGPDFEKGLARLKAVCEAGYGAGCSPHSLPLGSSHHQRPARSSSPGFTARVHGAQPIDG